MTNAFGKAMIYPVIALWKLEKPVVRRAPLGAFRYLYGKNDLYAQVIILKLLLADEDFRMFFHDLKMCFKKHPIHKEILEKMRFPKNWERIVRIKKYTKSEIKPSVKHRKNQLGKSCTKVVQ